MIFEQAYGKWFIKLLNAEIQKVNENLVCKQYDEVAYRVLVNDPDSVAVAFYGGNAARSQVEGQDQNVLPLSVSIVCRAEYSTIVREAIEVIQKAYNAVPFILSYKTTKKQSSEQSVKAIFNTPFVLDESDYHTRTETIKACYMAFSASVSYGETAVIQPESSALTIGEEVYPIEHIHSINKASIPSYDTYVGYGALCAGQGELSFTNSYALTVYKVAGDKLQGVFERELKRKTGGLAGNKLKLILDGEEIEIRTYQLTETYVNHAAAYTLTLGV